MANEKRLIEVAPLIDECKECMIIEWNCLVDQAIYEERRKERK